MNIKTTCDHLREYALTKDGKAIFSITDKELVKELLKFFPSDFKYKSTQLTTKKMGALLLLKEQGKEEPVCECCGNSLEDKFPWRDNQTTEERITIFGSWPRTCSLVCNQKLIKQEGKRDQTLLDRNIPFC